MNKILYLGFLAVFSMPITMLFLFIAFYVVSTLMLGQVFFPISMSSDYGVNVIILFIIYNGLGVGLITLMLNSNRWWGFDLMEIINIDHVLYTAISECVIGIVVYISIRQMMGL